jgi:hypothetical protein
MPSSCIKRSPAEPQQRQPESRVEARVPTSNFNQRASLLAAEREDPFANAPVHEVTGLALSRPFVNWYRRCCPRQLSSSNLHEASKLQSFDACFCAAWRSRRTQSETASFRFLRNSHQSLIEDRRTHVTNMHVTRFQARRWALARAPLFVVVTTVKSELPREPPELVRPTDRTGW